MKRSVSYLLYLLYIMAAVSLILLFLEGAGRVIIHAKYGVPGKSYGLWKYDVELGATHRFNAYNTRTSLNDYGFRNREDIYNPKPFNSLRIIAFGGSTTFGYNLADGETYTEKLESRLRRIPNYEKTQVLNAGRICYSAGHNLILMKRLVPLLKPDYVIIYEGVNEMMNTWALEQDGVSIDRLRSHYGAIGKSYDQNRWLKRNSIIVRFIDYYVKSRIIIPRIGTAPKRENMEREPIVQQNQIHPWVIENYKYVLRAMIDFLQKENVTPVVVRYASWHYPQQKIFSDISAQIAKEKGVLLCDMASRFKQLGDKAEDLFIETGVHVTPKGADILADELLETIRKDPARKRLVS